MSTLETIIQTTQQLLEDHGYTTTKTHITLTILIHNDDPTNKWNNIDVDHHYEYAHPNFPTTS